MKKGDPEYVAYLQKQRERYRTDASVREDRKRRSREYRKNNPLRCRERINAWRETNAGRVKDLAARDRKTGAAVFRGIQVRARKAGILCGWSREEFLSFYWSTNACHWCGVTLTDKARSVDPDGRQVDRLVASGNYTPENCVLACFACNRARAGLDAFLKRSGATIVFTELSHAL